jgi:trk system potassium uptake protein TrkH
MEETKKLSLDNFKLILYYISQFLVIVGIILILPFIALFFDFSVWQNYLTHFFTPGVVLVVFGVTVNRIYQSYDKTKLARNQDSILVVLTWIIAIFVSTIPFIAYGYSFTHAIFEVTSGYSTTGLSVVSVLEVDKTLLIYRSVLQLFGGVGFVLVLTSTISDKLGMRLYQAEGHSDQLVPNLLKSGKIIMRIYIAYITLGIILYVIFGMPLFDAINHSISAVATGGFSTRPESIGFYQSQAIENITMFLMVLGGTNFFVHLLLFRRKFKAVISHVELKVFAIIAFTTISISTIQVSNSLNLGVMDSLRISSFQLISSITGTGYQTIPSFIGLPSLLFFFIILTMILGAGMGSTAGGIKQYRIGLMAKSQYWQIKDMLSHKKTVRAKFINRVGNKMVIDKEDIVQNYMFITTYMTILILGTIIIMMYGHSFEMALFEFASTLGTVGLSVGIMNASAPNLILWVGSMGMFLGRLEFYVIFIAISKVFLDISHKKVV